MIDQAATVALVGWGWATAGFAALRLLEARTGHRAGVSVALICAVFPPSAWAAAAISYLIPAPPAPMEHPDKRPAGLDRFFAAQGLQADGTPRPRKDKHKP